MYIITQNIWEHIDSNRMMAICKKGDHKERVETSEKNEKT